MRASTSQAAIPRTTANTVACAALVLILGPALATFAADKPAWDVNNPPGPSTEAKIDTALIDPGKPWQNGDNESFNGKLRDECLNMEWFRHRTEARVVIEIHRRHYNEVRPHSSLGYLTPTEFRRRYESIHQGAILK